jgi:hypothetical protein
MYAVLKKLLWSWVSGFHQVQVSLFMSLFSSSHILRFTSCSVFFFWVWFLIQLSVSPFLKWYIVRWISYVDQTHRASHFCLYRFDFSTPTRYSINSKEARRTPSPVDDGGSASPLHEVATGGARWMVDNGGRGWTTAALADEQWWIVAVTKSFLDFLLLLELQLQYPP